MHKKSAAKTHSDLIIKFNDHFREESYNLFTKLNIKINKV